MNIVNVFIGTTTFEGKEYTKARAILEDGRELSIANEISELRELGSMDEVKSALRLHDGQHGPYLRLSNYKETEQLF